MKNIRTPLLIALTIVLLVALYFIAHSCINTSHTTQTPTQASKTTIASLFENKQSDVQVKGKGVVTKLLPDDADGGQHQRFILELESGQTLLVAHNIDLAPRLAGLAPGDTVEFYGEYYYNEQGGGIHWTHHDPQGKHANGWLKWKDSTYA